MVVIGMRRKAKIAIKRIILFMVLSYFEGDP